MRNKILLYLDRFAERDKRYAVGETKVCVFRITKDEQVLNMTDQKGLKVAGNFHGKSRDLFISGILKTLVP